MEVLDARLKAKGHNELHDALAREELFIPMKVTFEGEEYFLMKLLTEADYQNLMSRRMERAQKLQAGKAPQMNVYLRWMNKYASEKNTHIPQIHRQASQFYNPLSQFHGKVPQFRNQAPQFSIQDPQFRCQVLRFRSQIEPFYNLRQQFSKPVPERFNQGAQFYKWVPKNPQFKPVSISVGRATGGNEDDTGKAKSSSPPTARASSPAPAIRVATPISTVYVASPIPTTLSSLPTTPTRDVSPNATIPAISPPLAMRGSSLIPPMRTASSAPVSRPSSSALVPRTPPVALIYGDRPIPVSTRSAPARVLLVYNVWTPPAEWADPALRTTPRVPLLSHVLPTSVPDSPVKPKGLRGRLCWNRGSNTT
ncbi:uncharacterized protein BDR25DRAFT_54408 [Lindgomyces ingoldianus]|uniref:Uncharacterized protein n=1 Tax=Lindgomyces ingoldianus TaxID=673940 RepID=A0ACB6QPN3_9PLEO|nr:uncharacterized protein BDR25DRAFT_54408 [Lindgomyces ingoldianus]KAF2468958.1 hypothetical protein BDR25DRAFT_54408 [Lindgomyces ingoldianus]